MPIDPSNGGQHPLTSIPAISDAIMMGIETMITYIQDNISQQLDLESANDVILRAAPAQMDGEDRDARTVLPLQHSS